VEEEPEEILERSPPDPEGPEAREAAEQRVILALQVILALKEMLAQQAILALKEMLAQQAILAPKEIQDFSIHRQMELPEILAVHQVCWGYPSPEGLEEMQDP